MQFREQGKKIQCIRSTYDPATKRSHQKVVASFNRWADSLPSDGLEGLTEAERAELVEWFAAKQAKAQASRQQWKVGDAPRTLADLAESIRAADTLTADHAPTTSRILSTNSSLHHSHVIFSPICSRWARSVFPDIPDQ